MESGQERTEAEVFLIITLSVALVVLSFGGGLLYQRYLSRRDMGELSVYRAEHLWRSGWSSTYGSYELRSFDGGRHWYAVKTDDGMRVLGEADEGLLRHLKAWDVILEKAPLDLTKADDLDLLRNAGFRVLRK